MKKPEQLFKQCVSGFEFVREEELTAAAHHCWHFRIPISGHLSPISGVKHHTTSGWILLLEFPCEGASPSAPGDVGEKKKKVFARVSNRRETLIVLLLPSLDV